MKARSKHPGETRARAIYGCLAAIVLAAWGCSDAPLEPSDLELHGPAVRTTLVPVDYSIEVPAGVTGVTVVARSTDLDYGVTDIPSIEGRTAAGSLYLESGRDHTLTALGLNREREITHRGEATIDVRPGLTTVSIELRALAGDNGGDGDDPGIEKHRR